MCSEGPYSLRVGVHRFQTCSKKTCAAPKQTRCPELYACVLCVAQGTEMRASSSQTRPTAPRKVGAAMARSEGQNQQTGVLPEKFEAHMLFRRRMHRHWRERSSGTFDSGSSGLKMAMVEWSNLWLVSTALAMTVAFAMLIEGPKKVPANEPLDMKIAIYIYLGFTLRAMYLSLFLIVSCALWVQNTAGIPASDFSPFLASCSVKERPWIADPGDYVYVLYGNLLIAGGALCYVEYGIYAAGMCAFALVRFVTLTSSNLDAWQRALRAFELTIGVPANSYVSPWSNYGRGCCGQIAAYWNSVVGPSYGCFLGAGASRASHRTSVSYYGTLEEDSPRAAVEV